MAVAHPGRVDASANPPLRQIRARYDDHSITVYQAYSPAIAVPAAAAGRFVPPFKLDRMTWIKPSFLWMMYRCAWATKPGQEHVLAIRLTREGFERALAQACLSSFDPDVYADHEVWRRIKDRSPVRVQWDPERTPDLAPLPWRTIQIGLGRDVVREYVEEWTLGIDDITDEVRSIHEAGTVDCTRLPQERPYPLPELLRRRVAATPTPPPTPTTPLAT